MISFFKYLKLNWILLLVKTHLPSWKTKNILEKNLWCLDCQKEVSPWVFLKWQAFATTLMRLHYFVLLKSKLEPWKCWFHTKFSYRMLWKRWIYFTLFFRNGCLNLVLRTILPRWRAPKCSQYSDIAVIETQKKQKKILHYKRIHYKWNKKKEKNTFKKRKKKNWF